MTMHRNRKLLDLARDQACVNCGNYHGVVAAHSNQQAHGKGMGIKAHDAMCAFLCAACHAWADQGNGLDPTGLYDDTEKTNWMNQMILLTHTRLWLDGSVRVA